MCEHIKSLLDSKHAEYEAITDVVSMLGKGITHVPAIELDDGTIMKTKEAFSYVKEVI